MKRIGNLWSSICSKDSLLAAHYSARKGKSYYKEVKWVNENEEAAIDQIYSSLLNKTFTTSAYTIEECFDGRKSRVIYKLPYYPDRIVQHALTNRCATIWESSFIRDTFQSIPGRGTHDARKRVEKVVRGSKNLYALKFDIQKYYPSIDNNILKKKVRQKIKCPSTLWLLDDIIDSNPGLPIGNYTSQYLGNVYLSDFDWWVKQCLRPVGYFRYCDDFVFLSHNAATAHYYRKKVFNKLEERYNLHIKSDWQVFPVNDRGLDFVGFVFWPAKTKLRKSIAKGVKQKAKSIHTNSKNLSEYEIANGTGSYWGWCKYGGGKGLWQKHMTPTVKLRVSLAKNELKNE